MRSTLHRYKLEQERVDVGIVFWRDTFIEGRYDRFLKSFNRRTRREFSRLVELLYSDRAQRMLTEEQNMKTILSFLEARWSKGRLAAEGLHEFPPEYAEGLPNRLRRWINRQAFRVFCKTIDMEILGTAPMKWDEVPEPKDRIGRRHPREAAQAKRGGRAKRSARPTNPFSCARM